MSSTHILTHLQAVWTEVAEALTRSWETPTKTSQYILARLQDLWTETVPPRVIVAGSPEDQILCIVNENWVFLCSPRAELKTHPFVLELVEDLGVRFEIHTLGMDGQTENCLVTELSDHLAARLTLPSVLLVSLFHPEMYPASRLTLGISYLASYLRLYNLANVKMIDCQFGAGVDTVLEEVGASRPDILGVSVNFGQFDLLEKLLDGIYSNYVGDEAPLVILGNILPVMCYREILATYHQVVICRREGELTLAELVRCGHDRKQWSRIPGIYYRESEHSRIISTPAGQIPMEALPPPALDTVADLFAHDGVITSEFSRGCQYNVCSFCPRSHKGSLWRTLPVESMVRQWEMFEEVFRHFQRPPHVFLADEDFVGIEDGDATIHRMTSFLDQTRDLNLHITFDASCRADQIFREDRDNAWHVRRGNLFKRCLEGGLSRLFLGVESGASAQLVRYNKGSILEEMVSAIRYLSLLGVRLRFGFIFFDPLMSVQDLIENIEFLGRMDVVLPARRSASVEEIFHYVSSNHRKAILGSAHSAVYEDVSYMVSPLEVLAKSRYLYELRQSAPHLVGNQIDMSFARYPTTYVVPEIGLICTACQYWVNYCFPIVYALKGLLKVSEGRERELFSYAIKHHRYLGYLLIRSLSQIFALVDEETIQRWDRIHASEDETKELCSAARRLILAGRTEEAVANVLAHYERSVRFLMETVDQQSTTLFREKREVWHAAYSLWTATSFAEIEPLRVT